VAHHIGRVKYFDSAKGCGLLGRDRGADVFIHFTALQGNGYKTLRKGEIVEFDIAEGKQGPQAKNVRVLGGRRAPALSMTGVTCSGRVN